MNTCVPVQPREIAQVNHRLDEMSNALTKHLVEQASSFQAIKDASEKRDEMLEKILDATEGVENRVGTLENLKNKVFWTATGISLVVSLIVGTLKLVSDLDAQPMPTSAITQKNGVKVNQPN